MSLFERLMAFGLPIRPDSSEGAGVSVAILDGGVAPLPAFGRRLMRYLHDGQLDHGAPSEHATRCACLIASDDATAPGLAPRASVVSMYVSNHHRPDPHRVASALEWAATHQIQVVSASFVLEEIPEHLHRASANYVASGGLLIGAAANARARQQFPWVRQLEGTLRVFADRIPGHADSLAVQVAAPGKGLAVLDVAGDLVERWRGQSSAATAIVAGWCARELSDGANTASILGALRAHSSR